MSGWPGDHGFLNKPTDASTGLTHIGARYYDPLIGRFISVDPIMDLTDPQQWHGYAYANNNPITYTDPTGLAFEPGGGGGGGGGSSCQEIWECMPGISSGAGGGQTQGSTGQQLNDQTTTYGGAADPTPAPSAGAQLQTPGVPLANGAIETYYRAMSPQDFARLLVTGSVPATSETFISEDRDYAMRYYGVVVELRVLAGTTELLAEIGVRDDSRIVRQRYPKMPHVSAG